MSGLDIFAWIVLFILVASAIAVFCIAGWLPGHLLRSGWIENSPPMTMTS